MFPELVTQGSTWDPSIVEQIAAAVAAEARATGVDVAFSPVLNQWVDSRFGRLQEGFSENPTLTAAYAAAAAHGFQGAQPAGKWAPMALDKVVALGKHYAAYGAAEGGLNGAPAELSERTLREFFLKSWQAFAKAGGKGAMTAHNTVLGRPCHAHPYLVNDVFRDEFSFGDGIIVSDCDDIEALVDFRTAANLTHAAANALLGGVDLDLQCGGKSAYTQLEAALGSGLINMTTLDLSVKRVLLEKFATGLFDHPITDPSLVKQINNPAHQALALKAAEEGIVLLLNRPDEKTGAPTLPLSPSYAGHIAVIGPNGGCGPDPEARQVCGAAMNMLGSYTQFAHNPTGAFPVEIPTVHEAVEKAFSAAKVTYSVGANIGDKDSKQLATAVAVAKAASVAVVVVGDDLHTSSEWGDRDSLDLPGGQLQLLQAVVDTGTPVVLVTVTGRTPTFGGPANAVLGNVSAMLSAFRPGQMGGVAVANLLSGKANPSGKLAQSWVRSAGQAMSGAAPFLQWRVGKWAANHRGPADPDGRFYDPYNTHAGLHPTQTELTGVVPGFSLPPWLGGPPEASPLFRFGDGLSYSAFNFSPLSISAASSTAQTVATVSVKLTNSGKVPGTEVVQVYAQDPVMSFTRPWKRLLAFARVTVAPSASATVEVPLTRDQMMFYDDEMKLRLVPGVYNISVGGSSYSAAFNTATLTI